MEIRNPDQLTKLARVLHDKPDLPVILQQYNLAGDIVVFTRGGGPGGETFRLFADGQEAKR